MSEAAQGHDVVTDLTGRTVLVRAELANGVGDDLVEALRDLTARGARVAIVSGFGEPDGDVNPTLSLARFQHPIAEASGLSVAFINDCVGPVAEAGLGRVPHGEVALMENLRFHPEARRDSRNFAIRLSALGDHFAVTGPVPARPIGWLTALAALLPAPPGLFDPLFRKEP